MGEIKKHPLVKLIMGFIFNKDSYLYEAQKILIKKFGFLDYESPIIDFTYTDYYTEEMGKDLKRKFVSFEKLISPSSLADIKIFTNYIEKKFSTSGKRNINIDPGYLDLGKLILASTKDYSHRIYLKKDIFAEVTLFYKDKKFQDWPWTYPDYRTEQYKDIFSQIRKLYLIQLKNK